MLGQLSGKQEPDGSLDLPGSDGGALVVMGKAGSFGGDSFEDIVDERIHDVHRLARDSSVRVDLFQHLVDVDCVALLPPALLLLISLGDVLLSLTGFLGSLAARLWWHDAREFHCRYQGNDARRAISVRLNSAVSS